MAFPDNAPVSHFIRQTVLQVGGYRINRFTSGRSCYVLTTSSAAPRGPSRWTARPAAAPAGRPARPARSTAASRGTRVWPGLRGPRGRPARPYLSLHSLGQGLRRTRLLVLQPERTQQPAGHRGPSGLIDGEERRWEKGPRGAGMGRRAQKRGSGNRHQPPETDLVPSPPKIVFPFKRI